MGAATIENGRYPEDHDPADRFLPSLPADLFTKDSSRVCLGRVDYYFTDHTD